MKLRAKTLLAVPVAATIAALSFATPVFAWHITSTCGGGQWTVGLPDESWADGTIAKFDFDLEHTGDELYMTRGQSHAAPADATFVFVTYSNTDEQTAAYRPEGCIAPPATTVAPTTTLAPTTTVGATTSSVSVVTFGPPPAALLAVDIPPVPQPQGVSAAGSGQTLPATGGGSNLLLAGGIAVAAGAVAMLVARRRVA